MILVIYAACPCVDGDDELRHARQLVDDRVNGGLAQVVPVGVLQV